jgi:tetratricopeptide (TPR) repeat protein
MRHVRSCFSLILFGLLIIGTPRAGLADVQQAREHFKKGVEHFKKGEHASALAEFEKADKAQHAAAITYNIARVRENLGQAQKAVDAYEAYIAEAGQAGEFTSAATVAIAQIKARATQLRIESDPPGATVRVDGERLVRATPVEVYVFAGGHRVEIELGSWREERVYDAPGKASIGQLMFVRGEAPPPPPAPAPVVKIIRERTVPAAPRPTKPTLAGLMGGAALSLSGYQFLGSAEEGDGQQQTTSDRAAAGVAFGLAIDVGYAVSAKTALLARVFAAFGESRDDLATLAAGGPALTTRLGERWWLGGGLILGSGNADSDATAEPVAGAERDADVTFRTNFALGPMFELTYALGLNEDGQWVVSILPGLLLTTSAEQSTLFLPLVIGYRWF